MTRHTTPKRTANFNVRYFFRNLNDQIRTDRRTFILYTILRALVMITLVRSIMIGSIESAALCVFSLVLFLLPALAETQLRIEIPPLFEGMIYLFIFAAEILGEVNHYYVLIPGWDSMLHTINGFLCAAVGFSLVDLLNRHSPGLELSPLYLALVAFCFSMTIGVLWEFVEFAVDQTLLLDMQKDFVIQAFGSVMLDPTQSPHSVLASGIVRTTIECADGQSFVINGGYLDIGLIDTMKDLFVNFVGAAVCSTAGFLYTSGRAKGTLVRGFLIHRPGDTSLATISHDEREEAHPLEPHAR
ncbi:MAG: hypothetical protein ACFN02_02160 [Olsenella profusa]